METEQQEIKPADNLTFESFQHKDWCFYHSVYPMSDSKALEKLTDLAGTELPEVVYGRNHVYCVLPTRNFLLEICPVDALALTSFAKRETTLRHPNEFPVTVQHNGDESALNKVDMVPKKVQVKEAEIWQKKDTSKIEDFKQIEVISDWTFSNAYKSSLRFLSNHAERIKQMTGLEMPQVEGATQNSQITLELTDEQIPYHKLGPDNPIKHTATVWMYETDLEDSGYTYGQVRYRVMDDSVFILIRYYLRCDGVIVRLLDTRVYHEFGTNYMIREFRHLESDYKNLREQGFNPGSEWMLSDTQADEVSRFLQELQKVSDKIIF